MCTRRLYPACVFVNCTVRIEYNNCPKEEEREREEISCSRVFTVSALRAAYTPPRVVGGGYSSAAKCTRSIIKTLTAPALIIIIVILFAGAVYVQYKNVFHSAGATVQKNSRPRVRVSTLNVTAVYFVHYMRHLPPSDN